MSSFEIKEKEGSLFSNKKKTTDKHPDYTGSCVINGVKMNISSWVNKARTSGVKYMRLKFDEYQALEGASTSTSTPTPEFNKGDEEIPF